MPRNKKMVARVSSVLLSFILMFCAPNGSMAQNVHGNEPVGSPVASTNGTHRFSVRYPVDLRGEGDLFRERRGHPLSGAADEKRLAWPLDGKAKPPAAGSEASRTLSVDLDGAGVDDVLIRATTFNSTGKPRTRIMARRGGDGVLLWEKSFPALDADIFSPGDLDGDSRNDLIVYCKLVDPKFTGRSSVLDVIRGYDGALLWEAKTSMADTQAYPSGDFDGDHRPDVLFHITQYDQDWAVLYDSVQIRRGDNGSILWEETRSNAWVDGSEAGDLDGDGKSDVIIRIKRADAGTQTLITTVTARRGHDGSILWKDVFRDMGVSSSSLGDLDGDGKADALLRIVRYDSVYNIATFKTVAKRGYDGTVLWHKRFPRGYAAPQAAGDLDGDGIMDLILVIEKQDSQGYFAYDKIMAVRGNSGAQLWIEPVSGWAVSDLSVSSDGDLNGDTKADILIHYRKDVEANGLPIGRVTALRGDSGAHLWEDEIEKATAFAAMAGDLDGDKKTDVLVMVTHLDQNERLSGANLVIRRGLDGVPLWNKTLIGRKDPPYGYEGDISTGYDLDGDGTRDLVVTLNSVDDSLDSLYGRTMTLRGRDGSAFWSKKIMLANVSASAADDFSGDGKADVFLGVSKYDQEGEIRFGRITALRGDEATELWMDRIPGAILSAIPVSDLDGK